MWQPLTSPTTPIVSGIMPCAPVSNSPSLIAPMKNTTLVENVVLDEAHQRTYVVMARRVLTDGELFSAIRVALLRRGDKPLAQGERFVIDASSVK